MTVEDEDLATITDIANRCGISTATVSYVLNGHANQRRISVATQEKVLLAARELGYKRLSNHGRPVIEVYWLHKQLEFTIPPVINGVNNIVASELTKIDVRIRPYEPGHLNEQSALWEDSSCDAAIVYAAGYEDLEYLKTNPTKVHTILVNRDLPNYSSVSIDHEEAGRFAAQHAIQNCGEDAALILNPSSMYGLDSRAKSIIDTYDRNGINIRNNIFYCQNQIEDGYELGWELIRKKKLHKVFVCIYDVVGLGIMSAMNEAGISVGEDVQVIATSSSVPSLFVRSTPPMTVVDLKMEEVSERSLKVAIDLVTNRISGPQKIIVHPAMIYRQSCPMTSPADY